MKNYTANKKRNTIRTWGIRGLLLICLVLGACPRPEPPEPTPTPTPTPTPEPTATPVPVTSASGRVVDQAGAGIPGVLVSLNDISVLSTQNGDFSFPDLATGTYALEIRGGASAHYLGDPVQVVITSGANSLGEFTAYQIQAAGVIIQSQDARSRSRGSSLQSFPKAVPFSRGKTSPGGHYIPLKNRPLSRTSSGRAVSDNYLLDNISFIQIKWEPAARSADYYTVTYMGPAAAPLSPAEVWDSRDLHPEDGAAFDTADPLALLDLSVELAGRITTAGTYLFTVTAKNDAGEEVLSYPGLTVSLGHILGGYPENPRLEDTGDTSLRWNPVEAADWYRVILKEEDSSGPVVLLEDEITETRLILPAGLLPDTYYLVYLDAISVDLTGYSREICRALWGFMP